MRAPPASPNTHPPLSLRRRGWRRITASAAARTSAASPAVTTPAARGVLHQQTAARESVSRYRCQRARTLTTLRTWTTKAGVLPVGAAGVRVCVWPWPYSFALGDLPCLLPYRLHFPRPFLRPLYFSLGLFPATSQCCVSDTCLSVRDMCSMHARMWRACLESAGAFVLWCWSAGRA